MAGTYRTTGSSVAKGISRMLSAGRREKVNKAKLDYRHEREKQLLSHRETEKRTTAMVRSKASSDVLASKAKLVRAQTKGTVAKAELEKARASKTRAQVQKMKVRQASNTKPTQVKKKEVKKGGGGANKKKHIPKEDKW